MQTCTNACRAHILHSVCSFNVHTVRRILLIFKISKLKIEACEQQKWWKLSLPWSLQYQYSHYSPWLSSCIVLFTLCKIWRSLVRFSVFRQICLPVDLLFHFQASSSELHLCHSDLWVLLCNVYYEDWHFSMQPCFCFFLSRGAGRRILSSIFTWHARTAATCSGLTSSPPFTILSTTSPTSLCWAVTQVCRTSDLIQRAYCLSLHFFGLRTFSHIFLIWDTYRWAQTSSWNTGWFPVWKKPHLHFFNSRQYCKFQWNMFWMKTFN